MGPTAQPAVECHRTVNRTGVSVPASEVVAGDRKCQSDRAFAYQRNRGTWVETPIADQCRHNRLCLCNRHWLLNKTTGRRPCGHDPCVMKDSSILGDGISTHAIAAPGLRLWRAREDQLIGGRIEEGRILNSSLSTRHSEIQLLQRNRHETSRRLSFRSVSINCPTDGLLIAPPSLSHVPQATGYCGRNRWSCPRPPQAHARWVTTQP